MTDDTAGGAAERRASHCAEKSGGVEFPASGGTVGPQFPRKSLTLRSCISSRTGAGSGIHRLSWNAPLLDSRTVALHFRISSGCIRRAPQAPNPPALATAMDSVGALAPA